MASLARVEGSPEGDAAACVRPTVAVIGLGLMGAKMAAQLVKSGFPVVGYNRDASKAKTFHDAAAAGEFGPGSAAVEVAATAAEAVGRCVAHARLQLYCGSTTMRPYRRVVGAGLLVAQSVWRLPPVPHKTMNHRPQAQCVSIPLGRVLTACKEGGRVLRTACQVPLGLLHRSFHLK
jgi:hypothetical protein